MQSGPLRSPPRCCPRLHDGILPNQDRESYPQKLWITTPLDFAGMADKSGESRSCLNPGQYPYSINLKSPNEILQTKDGSYYSAGARWYATSNLMFGVTGEHAVDRSIGHISAEWQVSTPSLPGLAVFLDAAKGSNSFDQTLVGVRYYFGANKTLVQRHRQDDPDSLLGDSLISNQQQYRQRQQAAAAASGPAACPPMSVVCI